MSDEQKTFLKTLNYNCLMVMKGERVTEESLKSLTPPVDGHLQMENICHRSHPPQQWSTTNV